MKFTASAEGPAAVVTTTAAAPAEPLAVVKVTVVAVEVTEVAGLPPTVTPVVLDKLVPVTVVTVPPAVVPCATERGEVIVGIAMVPPVTLDVTVPTKDVARVVEREFLKALF